MGQHKYNPTAIAAANGELPPKPHKPSKRVREAALRAMILEAMMNRVPSSAEILAAVKPYLNE